MKTIFFALLISFGVSACTDSKPTPKDLNKNMTMPARNLKNTGEPNKY